MVQMAMGMMGLFIVHPRDPAQRRVDRDFAFLANAFDIDPGTYTPRVATMTEFNMWCWNSRVFPGIDHLAVRRGDRVRIRMGRSEEHTYELQSLMRISYAVFCLKKTSQP